MKGQELEFQEAVIRSSSNTLSELGFIQEKQIAALKRLEEINFPSKKLEDWKYFDFSDILGSQFNIKSSGIIEENTSGLSKKELADLTNKYVFRETADNLLVTINGNYSEELSNFDFENSGLKIFDFNNPEAYKSNKDLEKIVKELFAEDPGNESKYFKSINTALMTKGFLLYISPNHQGKKPLQILHISNKNNFNQVRALIYAGKNSKQELMVNYIGLADSNYFTNAVVECKLDQNAHLKIDKIQNESNQAIKLYDFHAQLAKDSNFEYNSFSFGAKSSRDDICVDINGSNAHASVNGLYVVNGERKSHHKVIINHAKDHSTSEQLFKGLLQDKAKAEFNGLIDVYKDAQQTDAAQLNKNLLLSKDAHVDSRPQLNILADDVKCSHGSTVGSLNQDELFYLESRGLSLDDAFAVLTYSFCQELIEKISLESAQNYTSNLAFTSISSKSNKTIAALAENNKFKKFRLKQND